MSLFQKFKLDFIVIGAQKAGTTALHHYLMQHPKINMSEEKELHFFDNDKLFEKDKIAYRGLHKHFNRSFGQRKICGEITPIYLFWEPCSKRIKDYHPKIKLIAILRDPVDRAFSHWNMEKVRGLEQRSFMECITAEIEERNSGSYQQHRIKSYVSRGIYSEQILRVYEYFPKEQVKFYKYEDFLEQQEETLNEVFQFLSVDSSVFNYEKQDVHKLDYSNEISEKEIDLLEDFYMSDINKVESLLSWNCQAWKN